jgi:predicted nucleic acid-binding protein
MGHNEKRTLADLPLGERIFVDSNILTYHLLDYPTFGPICEKFLQDILDKKYQGFITPIVASETLFNFIKAYILKTYGVKGKDVAILLKQDPKVLQEISYDRPKEIFGIFNILNNGAVEVENSFEYVSRYALLTNDALNAATMKANKIKSIATNDKDFERLPGVMVWGLL